jgi:tagaturonate epimerase
MKTLPRFTLGTGDRFGRQGVAQLTAIHDATLQGVPVHPVWNKSNREHSLIGTKPPSLREEADAAVRALGWTKPYFVDADHIGLQTVEAFLPCCDFFTIDVADLTGQPAPEEKLRAFVHRHAKLVGSHTLPNLDFPLLIDRADLEKPPPQNSSRPWRRPAASTATSPQPNPTATSPSRSRSTKPTPRNLLPNFSRSSPCSPTRACPPKPSRRNSPAASTRVWTTPATSHAFEREFDADLAVIALAIDLFGLPRTLKISVHSGSDKFSIYPAIRRLVEKHNAGLHLKTAGTTWLEEVTGLAESGGEGLRIAKDIYAAALPRAVDLIQPYAPVVDIDPATLPADSEVEAWTAEEFVGRLEHNQSSPLYDPQFRQFLHVSFRVAAEMGARFTDALEANAAIVNRRVRANLLDKHILPLFPKT